MINCPPLLGTFGSSLPDSLDADSELSLDGSRIGSSPNHFQVLLFVEAHLSPFSFFFTLHCTTESSSY